MGYITAGYTKGNREQVLGLTFDNLIDAIEDVKNWQLDCLDGNTGDLDMEYLIVWESMPDDEYTMNCEIDYVYRIDLT